MSLVRKQIEADKASRRGLPVVGRTRGGHGTDMLAGFDSPQLHNELSATKKVVDILAEKFDVENPLYVIIMIKRKIKAGKAKEITGAKIRQWDKAAIKRR